MYAPQTDSRIRIFEYLKSGFTKRIKGLTYTNTNTGSFNNEY